MIEYAPVPGYPGYRVGNDGSVWSCRSAGCKPRETETWRQLATPVGSKGYPIVQLGRGNTFTVHMLVLLAFHGPLPEGQETRHLDGVKTNCRLDNLCYGSAKENAADRVRHGTANGPTHPMTGVNHPQAKMNPATVRRARNMRDAGYTITAIAERFGVNSGTICDVVRRVTWKHVN